MHVAFLGEVREGWGAVRCLWHPERSGLERLQILKLPCRGWCVRHAKFSSRLCRPPSQSLSAGSECN
eukprot:2285009-Rhodomonas_salina.1